MVLLRIILKLFDNDDNYLMRYCLLSHFFFYSLIESDKCSESENFCGNKQNRRLLSLYILILNVGGWRDGLLFVFRFWMIVTFAFTTKGIGRVRRYSFFVSIRGIVVLLLSSVSAEFYIIHLQRCIKNQMKEAKQRCCNHHVFMRVFYYYIILIRQPCI